MSKNQFYIGWRDDNDQDGWLKKFLMFLIVGSLLLIGLVSFVQRDFNDHVFELGKYTEVTGVYFDRPVPMLYVDEGFLPEGLSRDVLLIGYGKFGAEGIMEKIKEKAGKLGGVRVSMSGTLIYGDGKTLLELTKKEESFKLQYPGPRSRDIKNIMGEEVTMRGEILDPKCYFGVMKPGEGKVHKSCAIRCISGGIPPVFRKNSTESENGYEYYILLGELGAKINHEILDRVGEQVEIKGQTGQFLNWKILYASPDEIFALE